jgi:hypothetical protein
MNIIVFFPDNVFGFRVNHLIEMRGGVLEDMFLIAGLTEREPVILVCHHCF